MLNRIRRIIKKLRKAIFWYRLKYHTDKDIRTVAGSLDFIINNRKWENAELLCFEKINKIRKHYCNSNETVLVKDFGAGSSGERTEKEMEVGVDSVKKVADIYKITSSPDKWGKLIFKLIRDIKPENCLELGTSLGISAAYHICALKLNQKGELTSIEGAPEVANLAKNNLENLNFRNFNVKVGKFKDVLPKKLSKEKAIDFVFIDGHHDKVATKEYFEILYPNLANRAILIFDDIDWSPGMQGVWKEIYNDHRINFSLDLNKWGICHINKIKDFDETRNIKITI